MECVGGNVGCHSDLKPTVMQCRNMGSDGVDVQVCVCVLVCDLGLCLVA